MPRLEGKRREVQAEALLVGQQLGQTRRWRERWRWHWRSCQLAFDPSGNKWAFGGASCRLGGEAGRQRQNILRQSHRWAGRSRWENIGLKWKCCSTNDTVATSWSWWRNRGRRRGGQDEVHLPGWSILALTFTLFTLIKLINDHFSEPPDSEDSEAERSERRQYNRSVFTSTAYQLQLL